MPVRRGQQLVYKQRIYITYLLYWWLHYVWLWKRRSYHETMSTSQAWTLTCDVGLGGGGGVMKVG